MDQIQLELDFGNGPVLVQKTVSENKESFEAVLEEIRLESNQIINSEIEKIKSGLEIKDSLKKIKNK